MFKVEDYKGPAPKFHKGRAESATTVLIRETLLAAAATGGYKKLTGLTSRELLTYPTKIRAVAGKERLSVNIVTEEDSIILGASRIVPKSDSATTTVEEFDTDTDTDTSATQPEPPKSPSKPLRAGRKRTPSASSASA